MTPRIALVDDENSVRVALARVLRLAGYEVATYACGSDFLAAVEDFQPDCALLDVHMPGLTGLQVQQQLCARQLRLPAVFITASGDEDVERHVLDAGGHCLLHKPFSSHVLLTSVEAAINASTSLAP
jgi:FixJ family two-component response regulator